MSVPATASRTSSRSTTSAVTGVVLFAGLVVLVLLWAKWLPYGDKLSTVAADDRWTGAPILEKAGGAGATPSLANAWDFTATYFGAVWKAYVGALVIGAAFEALVPRAWLKRAMGGREGTRGSLAGGVAAIPSMMCTACAAPVAAAMRREGAPASATLGYLIGSPVLNPVVITFIALLAPWEWVATRITVGLLLTFGLTAVVARLASPAAPGLTSSAPAAEFELHEAGRRFLDRLLALAVQLTPVYVVGIFVLGLVSGWVFPIDGNEIAVVALAVAVVAGTLIDLPTAGEVPLLLVLAAAGLSTGALGALLITLPAISAVTMGMIAPTHTWRVTLGAAGAVAASGLLAAGMLAVLSL